MKIKKILLYNFKNFKNKTVVDFKNNVTFLVGPNGFGKTTIFDAIELGLTGNISRVELKDKITPENIKYNKPFFQNDINLPVIIKLWLEKDNSEQLIIVRKFENNELNSKKIFAPIKSISQFQLFQQDDTSDSEFDKIENQSQLRIIKQDIIDEFLDIQGKYEIKKIFNLFNYIQQEETTFFLKQNEQKRSDSLSFLIKTDEIEDKISKIEKKIKLINNTIQKFEGEKSELAQQEMRDVPYQRLFNHKDFPFDNLEPFSDDNLNQLKSYQEAIQNISEFKQNFSITEYKRMKERNHKISLIDKDSDIKDALYFSILSPIILRPDQRWKYEKNTLAHLELFEYVLLENYIIGYDQVILETKRRKQLNNYTKILSSDIHDMAKLKIDYNKDDELSNDLESLNHLLIEYQALSSDVSHTDKKITELTQLRSNLSNKFDELRKHHHVDNSKCPFCNSSFETFEELKVAYDGYKEYLIRISSDIGQQLQNIQIDINNLVNTVKQRIIEELSKLKVSIDETMLIKIRDFHNSYQSQAQNINGFKNFVQYYIELSPVPLGNLSNEEYLREIQLCQEKFRSKLVVDDAVYNLFNIDKLENIRKNSEKLEREYSELNFLSYQFQNGVNEKISRDIIDRNFEQLKAEIKSLINKNYSINEALINDPNRILSKYFNNNLALLEKITAQDLDYKIHYIEKKSKLIKSRKNKELLKKIEILNRTKDRLEEVNEIYQKEVKKFKINIIKQLRIPFYIYSAKMLQNYQQGLGIFLTYKEATENTEEKAVIKFKSDPNTDHDAIYQLSTGQLAVVSLAFTLSLNTMFKLSEQLNFLMIDDPIQDMDTMNVLSFIEILRHGIIDKYQIILSTYSDSSALFMGYKFVNLNTKIDVDYKNVRNLEA